MLGQHIEAQFVKGMSWENYGDLWSIDHIRPIGLAKTKDEAYGLNHYTNLQPLLVLDNSKKGAKTE